MPTPPPTTPPTTPPTVLPFDGVPPQPTPYATSTSPHGSENADHPSEKGAPKQSLFRRFKRNVFSSAFPDPHKHTAEQTFPSVTPEQVITLPQHNSDEQQSEDERRQRFLDVVNGVPDANYQLPPDVAEVEQRKQRFMEQLHGIPPEPDPQTDPNTPQTDLQSSASPNEPHQQLPYEQPHPAPENRITGSQTFQPPPQPRESASEMAEFFGGRAYGGRSNTFIGPPTSPPSQMSAPQNLPPVSQAWPQPRPVGWAGITESFAMGPGSSYRQPQPYSFKRVDGLSDLDPDLAWRIGRGRDLGLRAVELEEAGNLGHAESVYIEALSLLVPASRELDHGPESNQQMRMRQKARVQREAAAMLDRCEEIKLFLKANGPSVPQQMPTMPGSLKSMKSKSRQSGSSNDDINYTSSTNMYTPQRKCTPNASPHPSVPPPQQSVSPPPSIPPPPSGALSGPDDALYARLKNRSIALSGAFEGKSEVQNNDSTGGALRFVSPFIPPSVVPAPPSNDLQSSRNKSLPQAPETESHLSLYPSTASPKYLSATSQQFPSAASPQYPPSTSRQIPSAAFPQYLPSTSPQYPPSTSPRYPLTTLPQYPPATSPQHSPSTSPQYPLTTSPQYPSATSPQYPSATSPQYPPATSPQHSPSTSPQYPPTTSPQYPSSTSSIAKVAPSYGNSANGRVMGGVLNSSVGRSPHAKSISNSIDCTGEDSFLGGGGSQASSVSEDTPIRQMERLSVQGDPRETSNYGPPSLGPLDLQPVMGMGGPTAITRTQSADLSKDLSGVLPSMSMAMSQFPTVVSSKRDEAEPGFQKMSRHNGFGTGGEDGVERCVICSYYANLRAPCGHGFCTKCGNQAVTVFENCPAKNCGHMLSIDTFEHIL